MEMMLMRCSTTTTTRKTTNYFAGIAVVAVTYAVFLF